MVSQIIEDAKKHRKTRNIRIWNEISTGKIEQNKKTAWPDGIVIEMLKVLEDSEIDKITDNNKRNIQQ